MSSIKQSLCRLFDDTVFAINMLIAISQQVVERDHKSYKASYKAILQKNDTQYYHSTTLVGTYLKREPSPINGSEGLASSLPSTG